MVEDAQQLNSRLTAFERDRALLRRSKDNAYVNTYILMYSCMHVVCNVQFVYGAHDGSELDGGIFPCCRWLKFVLKRFVCVGDVHGSGAAGS